MEVDFPDDLRRHFSAEEQTALVSILSLDPRPHYHADPQRIYGMPFAGRDIRFRVSENTVYVVEIV